MGGVGSTRGGGYGDSLFALDVALGDDSSTSFARQAAWGGAGVANSWQAGNAPRAGAAVAAADGAELRALQSERDALAARLRDSEQRAESQASTSRQSIAMLLRAARSRLAAKDDLLRDAVNAIDAPSKGVREAPLSDGASSWREALERARHDTEAFTAAAAESSAAALAISVAHPVAAAGGNAPATLTVDTAASSSGQMESLRALQREVEVALRHPSSGQWAARDEDDAAPLVLSAAAVAALRAALAQCVGSAAPASTSSSGGGSNGTHARASAAAADGGSSTPVIAASGLYPQLRRRVAELESAQQQDKATQAARIAELEEALQAARAAITAGGASRTGDSTAVDTHHTAMQTALYKDAAAREAALRVQLDAATAEAAAAKARASALEASLRSSTPGATSRAADASSEAALLEARAATAAAVAEALAREHAASATARQSADADVSESLAATAAARAEADAAAALIVALRAKLAAAESRSAELEAAISGAERDARAARHGLDAAQSALAAAEERAAALQLHQQQLEGRAAEREATLRASATSQFAALKARALADLEASAATAAKREHELSARLEAAATASSRILPAASRAAKAAASVAGAQRALATTTRTAMAAFSSSLASTATALLQSLASHASTVSDLRHRLEQEHTERRRLHNLVQELRGNIRVFARVRPPLQTELEAGSPIAATFPAEGELRLVTSKRAAKTWEFDAVFPPSATNDTVFAAVEPLVVSVMDGYHVCVFAYGQTGSGKTFTMEGIESARGVNYRTLAALFDLREARKLQIAYELSISMLEIYLETVVDCLAPVGRTQLPSGLTVREGPNGNYVPDLVVQPVSSFDEVMRVCAAGYARRTTFATAMNERSSRSHCILTINVTGRTLGVQTPTVMRGKLHLVDLAGSERVSKSGASGDRLKEAASINKSLSALGDVIAARAEKRLHVPFRNSTLTWLLADSLSGDSKTLMIAAASPVLANADETACTLNFAARVGSVELGRATRHVGQSPAVASRERAGGGAATPASVAGVSSEDDVGGDDTGADAHGGAVEDATDEGVSAVRSLAVRTPTTSTTGGGSPAATPSRHPLSLYSTPPRGGGGTPAQRPSSMSQQKAVGSSGGGGGGSARRNA